VLSSSRLEWALPAKKAIVLNPRNYEGGFSHTLTLRRRHQMVIKIAGLFVVVNLALAR